MSALCPTLRFTYDAAGNPLTLTYNGTKYYYNTNLQGDVVGILDSSGATVVTYIYDAWGRPYSTTGSLASTLGADNPLRYRGYVYDSETWFYYLQSRYYSFEWGKFISPDVFTSTGQGLTGNNMFAYCGNNPVSRKDDGGEFWNIVIGAAVGAVVNATITAIDTYTTTGSIDWGKVAISATVGGISGGIAATGLGAVVQAGISAGASFVGSVATDIYDSHKENRSSGKTTTVDDVGKMLLRATGSAAISFGASLIGSGAGSFVSKSIKSKGNSMILSSKGTTYLTRASARNMYNQGKAYINTAHGLSSVVGTMFTWPTSTALSMGLWEMTS